MLKNYNAFRDEMILRDYLALDRTVLANERTLLAYLRTFIGALSAGIALIKLFDTVFITVTGFVFVIISPLFLVFGIIRFAQISKKINSINEAAPDKQ